MDLVLGNWHGLAGSLVTHRRRQTARRAWLASWCGILLPCAIATAQEVGAATTPATLLAATTEALGADIDPRVAATLPRLRGSGRQLLALRSYLRSRQHLGERWSWTDEEVAAYEGSAAQAALLAEIGKVRAAFESANPGYSLWVNPQLRTLDRQIHGWNANESVAAAASLLEAAGLGLVSDPGFPAGDVAGARQSLQTFLGNHRPQPTPTIAAPGLSPHGQMHAVDFQISREGVIVAGTSAAAIATEWEGPGWAARLQAAVSAASIRFAGPLEKPREPWHYTYVPDPGIPTAALPHDASIPNSNNR